MGLPWLRGWWWSGHGGVCGDGQVPPPDPVSGDLVVGTRLGPQVLLGRAVLVSRREEVYVLRL